MSFAKICNDIKALKIQGARNVALAGLKALQYKRDPDSVKKLLKLRITEPCLRNAVNFVMMDFENNYEEAIQHFETAKEKITDYGSNKIDSGDKIFTHCHSSTVADILIRNKRKKITVYNTETRPNYQGRIMAAELAKNGIKVMHFVDAAARLAIKEADIMMIGCDAITTEKIYNKIGSELFVELANRYDVPVYVCTNSWKFDGESIYGVEEKIENRNYREVWERPPKGVTIMNPAFEAIDIDLITAIISEIGVYNPETFLVNITRHYPWINKRGE